MNSRRRLTLHMASAALASALPMRLAAQAPAPRIVASFSILADMVREVAPPQAQVTALVGPDADAHTYEPTPADARRLAQADLVVVNGLGFEGWMPRMVKVSGYRGPLVVASQGIRTRDWGAGAAHAQPHSDPAHRADHERHGHAHARSDPHAHAADTDPHAWQDLRLARQYVQHIGSAMARRWPDQAALIDQRQADYQARIDQQDAQVRQWLDAVPRAQRRVITSHDAFGYFGAAYGVDFMAPQGWSTHSEPSAAAVARLIRQIRQEGVRALFLENISDPRLVQRIAEEAGARVGGTLYSDALSKPGGPAATYLQMMAHNARTIAAALAG